MTNEKGRIFSETLARGKTFLILVTLVLVTVTAVGSLTLRRVAGRLQQQRRLVTSLPPVVSKVRSLEVISAKVNRLGAPDAAVAVEVRNNSDLAVMSVTLSTKAKGETAGVTTNGLADPDDPHVVIEPHGTQTIEIALAELLADAPLAVSAAVFADGTEDGEPSALDAVRSVRQHDQAERERTKGVPRR